MHSLLKYFLRRKFFKGQYRLFFYLFKHQFLQLQSPVLATPLKGNFSILCDTKTWIGAQIYYLGEYEDYIKATFERFIKIGDTVLDIGANIGFHTLFFAELVGPKGKVIAFEPMPYNYQALLNNIALDEFENIATRNYALSDQNESLKVNASSSQNPGAFNLFEKGETHIDTFIGDEVISEKSINFIKIDVEGFEYFVLKGLVHTIKTHQPTIVFEYDKNYQNKTNLDPIMIFELLENLGYHFQEIKRNGLVPLKTYSSLISCDILAIPIDHQLSSKLN